MRCGQIIRVERVLISSKYVLVFIVLLMPTLFLRYGNLSGFALVAMQVALPVAATHVVFRRACIVESLRAFTIHRWRFVRFSAKLVCSAMFINVCLAIGYAFVVGVAAHEMLALQSALLVLGSSCALTVGCFAMRILTSNIVSGIVVGLFVIVSLPVGSGMLSDSLILHLLIPTTWVLTPAAFYFPTLAMAGFVFCLGALGFAKGVQLD